VLQYITVRQLDILMQSWVLTALEASFICEAVNVQAVTILKVPL